MANFTRIAELSPHRNDYIIRVKILKKWKEMIFGGGDILSFLLVDEHGEKIPAKVSPEIGLNDDFDFNLHEGHWMIISGFIVELTPPPSLFSENNHTIIFTEDTDLHVSTGVHQDHYMEFKDYTDIKNGVYNSHRPIDLIGYLDDVEEIRTVKDHNFRLAPGKKTSRVMFTIKGLDGVTLECKAYGVLADQLYDKWWYHGTTETFITMSDWMVYGEQRTGELKIKDAGGISRFEFNADYQDVYDFSAEYFNDSDGSVEEVVVVSP
ncbi:unnamed protein product [Microthlaspi erraticum]|uniref:Replication protein A 70 kDa DNA-binding subunit B/D first OB fold domain-containing protein n=1 Tax=Microthlaspi erraticum TaxID=1685480 RepID=A0A6D2J394_9BRAS|nr:unnamed protein product [Microthlaspi erraticum]CAA7031814.1 unnamed protein product [Microthlaspi erraticum]CAA7058502.1 unnamed protein product [Microthlaspi erraticum]CAA7062004.1 unnamed protein product [Microthlaspi erraticum]